MARVVLFDFDGTIADTFGALAAIYNRVAPAYGCTPVNVADIPELRKQRPQTLLRRYGVRFFNLPFLLRRMQRELHAQMASIAPHAGVLDAIRALHAQGMTCGILTSNTTQNVEQFLSQHAARECFTFVHSERNVFGKDRAFRRLLRAMHWQPEDVLYVGDETRDIEAAHRAGIRVVAVGWGFHAPEALRALQPDAFVTEVVDLLPTLTRYCNAQS